MNITKEETILKAHAKVNLFLQVLNKDEKNYHLLRTVFQPLLLEDKIIIKKNEGNGIRITSNENIPTDERNSVYKAIKIICDKTGRRIKDLNYDIHIEKQIPLSSGLGGSAVDAAPIINWLNKEMKLGMNLEKMCEIGSKIGADVPQAFYNNVTYAERYGDKITSTYELPRMFVSIYIPNGYMSAYKQKTSTLYQFIDEEKKELGENFDRALMARLCLLKKAIENKKLNDIGKLMYNDFELVAFKFYPTLRAVKEKYLECGAYGALLAGSGGAVFGLFDKPEEVVYASNRIEEIVGRENGKIILTETLGY